MGWSNEWLERGDTQQSWQRWRQVAAVLACLGLVLLLWRGPLHFVQAPVTDFIPIYCSASVYYLGGNPYDLQAVQTFMGPRTDAMQAQALLYPPTSLMLLSPLGLLDWPWAKLLWALINLGCLFVSLWCIGRWYGLARRETSLFLFVALACCFLPVHTAFRQGQTALIALALISASLVLTRAAAGAGSGLLMVLAAALKPQMGLLLLAWRFGRAAWADRVTMLLGSAVLGVLALLAFWANGVDWFASWQANVQAFTHGGAGDPTPANALRYQMIHLQPTLHLLLDDRLMVNAVTWLFTGGLALLGWWRFASLAPQARAQAMVSLLAVLSLLWSYHRTYDAVLLLLPLAFVLASMRLQGVRLGHVLALGAMVPIACNSAVVLHYLQRTGRLPVFLEQLPGGGQLLIAHQPLTLVALAVILIVASPHWRAPSA